MSYTFDEKVTLVTETCINCGVTFAVPSELLAHRRKNHNTFYCPNGHNMYYRGKSDEEKLREELQKQREETIRQRDNYFTEQRKHEETQRKLQRLKKRTAAGVCPCCKRTFSQLARHMHSKHADFVQEHGIPPAPETTS